MSQAHRIPTFPTAHPFPPLAYKGTPVLTTEMLAQAYEVTPKQIRQNFANNRDRFIEGKHFFSVSGQELKDFRLCVENFDSQISTKVRVLILYTNRGCARHAKSLNTDRAWDMYELLEETFFAVVKTDHPVTLNDTTRPSRRTDSGWLPWTLSPSDRSVTPSSGCRKRLMPCNRHCLKPPSPPRVQRIR